MSFVSAERSEETDIDTIFSLADVTGFSVAQVGGKAWVLGRLSAAGFSVPDGFCMPVDAFRETNDGANLPADVVEQLRQRFSALHAPHGVAVRSSSTAEDRVSSSAAGQFETILGVRTFDELLDAVVRCQRRWHCSA